MTGSPPRLAAALADRYRIECKLGAGGMATVYLAEDLNHDRKVALKVLKPELAALLGPGRFLQEIRVTANLQHPHIVPLFDSGEADGFLYYVMPYVEGETLRRKLERDGRVPLQEALQITHDVADALSYSHAREVLHRDIKPENILLSGGHALVADFGIARAIRLAAEEGSTLVGLPVGTPGYMSPEQALASAAIDQRTDVYSLGCVLYEMLVGDRPPASVDRESVTRHRMIDVPLKHRASLDRLPPAFEAMLTRALAHSPADRFATAQELAQALPATGQEGAGWWVDGRRGRKALMAGLAATVFLAAGALAVLAVRSGRHELTPKRVVVAVFENQTGDPSLDPLGRMASDWITLGLQRTGMVDVVPSPTLLQAARVVQSGPERRRSGDASIRALAQEVGAGTVISGAYYRYGDTLQFQTQVTDAIRGRLLGALDPVRGSRASPQVVIERLRERVTGLLALTFDERLTTRATTSTQPPTYEAYNSFNRGMELYVRQEYRQALPHLYRAFELDSTFPVPLLFAAMNEYNLLQVARADSVLQVLARFRDQLTPYHRYWLEYLQAVVAGENERALSAISRAAEAAPGSKAVYNFAFAAVRTNRPRQALEALANLDPERGPMRGWYPYWLILTWAQHLLGGHADELEAAERARKLHPGSLQAVRLEADALAALGRVNAVNHALTQAAALPAEGIWTWGLVAATAAADLRAHRQPEAARELFQRAIDWFEARPPAEAETEEFRTWYGATLYNAGRWDEAERVYTALAAEFPDVVRYRGLLGVLAARRGDRDKATEVSEWLRSLNRPYLSGENTMYRARITAVLGDRQQAVELLGDALSQGQEYSRELHTYIDFEVLGAYQPFQELMRPRE